jgi:site-specific recombinase XerC
VLDHRDFESTARFCEPDGYDLLIDFLDRHWGDSRGDTIGQRAAVVRSFFKWAKRSGRSPFNPADEIKVPRGSRRLHEAHDLAEIRLIAGAQLRIGDEAAVLVLGRLALRKMEAARLQARDVNLGQDVIYIRAAKGYKPAELPITFPEVRQALSLWLSEPGRADDDYLIAPLRGPNRALNPASVHRWWERCCKRAGVEAFTLHELRHSAGDRLWRETGDLYAAKQLLRHESVKTTETYLHPSANDLRARMLESDSGESVHKPSRSQALCPCECTITGVMSSWNGRRTPAAAPLAGVGTSAIVLGGEPVCVNRCMQRSGGASGADAEPARGNWAKKFAEPVSVSSTAFADLSLAGSAFELGFDLLRFRARRKGKSRATSRPVQGASPTSRPQFAEIQFSTFPQQGVQLVDKRPCWRKG